MLIGKGKVKEKRTKIDELKFKIQLLEEKLHLSDPGYHYGGTSSFPKLRFVLIFPIIGLSAILFGGIYRVAIIPLLASGVIIAFSLLFTWVILHWATNGNQDAARILIWFQTRVEVDLGLYLMTAALVGIFLTSIYQIATKRNTL
jgi:hypothetical protein